MLMRLLSSSHFFIMSDDPMTKFGVVSYHSITMYKLAILINLQKIEKSASLSCLINYE